MGTYRYQSFVENHFGNIRPFGSEVLVQCVAHDDSNASMQVNMESGLWLCFACGAQGNINTLGKWLGVTVEDNGIELNTLRAKIDALRKPNVKDIQSVLPESTLNRYKFPTDYWEKVRGFEPRSVAAFDLGYSPVGDSNGAFASIPMRTMNGDLLGIIKRYMDPDVDSRYKYPKGFKKSNHLFGSWLVAEDTDTDYVALCEGSLDAIKIWQAGIPALAVLGSSISPQQIRLLRLLGVGQIGLFFDNDKAGHKILSSCLGFHRHRRRNEETVTYDPATDLRREFLVSKVSYPRTPYRDNKGRAIGDPGAMTTRQIRQMLRKAASVS